MTTEHTKAEFDHGVLKLHRFALEAASKTLAEKHEPQQAAMLKYLSEQVAAGHVESVPSRPGSSPSPDVGACVGVRDEDGNFHTVCVVADSWGVTLKVDGQIVYAKPW